MELVKDIEQQENTHVNTIIRLALIGYHYDCADCAKFCTTFGCVPFR
jgi:hypothetical protein